MCFCWCSTFNRGIEAGDSLDLKRDAVDLNFLEVLELHPAFHTSDLHTVELITSAKYILFRMSPGGYAAADPCSVSC